MNNSQTFFQSPQSPVVQAKTGNYTAVVSDTFIKCDSSGGTFTVTLYPASGNAGRSLTIKKTDSSFTAVTIDANASETIDGSLTTTINTQYESLTIFCDGSNWFTNVRRIPSVRTSTTVTGSWSSNTTYTGFTWRVGDSLWVYVRLALSGAPTSAALSITIPNSLTIDTGKITTNTDSNYVGSGCAFDTSAGSATPLYVEYLTSSTVKIRYSDDGSGYVESRLTIDQASPWTWASGDALHVTFQVPITGWNG